MSNKWEFFTSNEIKPDGWLRRQLELQADGLCGNLDLVWRDIRDSKWIGGDAEGWERVPYWLDGFVLMAYLLDDADKIARAKRYIDSIVAAQYDDGWICPCDRDKIEKYDNWAVLLIAKVLTVYRGASNQLPAGDLATGLNFTEFMERFDGGRYLFKYSMQSNYVGLKFSDFQFVFEDKSDISGTFDEPLFGGNLVKASAEGSASLNIDSGNYTVSGLTGNSASSSASRIWLKGDNATSLIDKENLKTAQGIKFYVDTTALGSNAQLKLRVRMILGASTVENGVNGLGECIFGLESLGYSATQPDGWDQYVARVNGAAYYYNDAGETVPIYSVAGSADSTNPGRTDKCTEEDFFDALPVGYKGYVYIPMDSFGYSREGYNSNIILPWEYVAERYPIHQIALCGLYEGTPETDSVTYSNFSVVYNQAFEITFDVDGSTTTVVTSRGEKPTYPNGTPTRAETDTAAYEFTGWDKEIVEATETATYTAQFKTINKYKITFMVEGTPTEVSVKEGETPRYPGLPIKAADDTNKYTFEKWDKEIVAATETTTYTAVFKAVPKNGSTTDSDPTDDTTAAPETTAPTQTTEPAEKKSGCKGSVAIAGVAVVMAIGTAVLVKKKED